MIYAKSKPRDECLVSKESFDTYLAASQTKNGHELEHACGGLLVVTWDKKFYVVYNGDYLFGFKPEEGENRTELTFKLVAFYRREHTSDNAGVIDAAYEVVADDSRTGKAFYQYGWFEDQVEEEQLRLTPNLAPAAREWVPEGGPHVKLDPLAWNPRGSCERLVEHHQDATEIVYNKQRT